MSERIPRTLETGEAHAGLVSGSSCPSASFRPVRIFRSLHLSASEKQTNKTSRLHWWCISKNTGDQREECRLSVTAGSLDCLVKWRDLGSFINVQGSGVQLCISETRFGPRFSLQLQCVGVRRGTCVHVHARVGKPSAGLLSFRRSVPVKQMLEADQPRGAPGIRWVLGSTESGPTSTGRLVVTSHLSGPSPYTGTF